MEEQALKLDPKVKISTNNRKNKVFEFSNKSIENEFIKVRGEYLLSKVSEYLNKDIVAKQRAKVLKALITVEEKIHKDAKETQENIDFYFSIKDYDKNLFIHEKMKVDIKTALTALEESLKDLVNLSDWTIDKIKDTLTSTIEKLELKNGQLLWPLRVALSGLEFSPGVFETAWVLEKEETIKRIQTAITKLN